MKKILVLLFLISLSIPLFAEISTEYEGKDGSGKAELTLTIKTDDALNSDYICFGFTDSSLVGDKINTISSIALSESFISSSSVSASGVVYAYIRVVSKNRLKFSLSWSSLQQKKNDTVDLYINGKNGSLDIYSFNPSSSVIADERITLNLKTGDYDNSAVVGDYSTTVKLTVSAV